MGGGRAQFRNITNLDEEGHAGHRTDGRNLIDEWIRSKRTGRATYVWNAVKMFSFFKIFVLHY